MSSSMSPVYVFIEKIFCVTYDKAVIKHQHLTKANNFCYIKKWIEDEKGNIWLQENQSLVCGSF